MRRTVKGLVGIGIVAASLAGAPGASASQPNNGTTTAPSPVPIITALDCQGTTGNMGCGAGWYWRDGWKGWACYPC
jgi:hypothetical protein